MCLFPSAVHRVNRADNAYGAALIHLNDYINALNGVTGKPKPIVAIQEVYELK